MNKKPGKVAGADVNPARYKEAICKNVEPEAFCHEVRRDGALEYSIPNLANPSYKWDPRGVLPQAWEFRGLAREEKGIEFDNATLKRDREQAYKRKRSVL